jgi:DNA-binding transcriptional ArsR family regulator
VAVELEDALRIATALADRSRLLILSRLTTGPACVEELAADLRLAASTVSFHVKKLRLAGLVTARKNQYYSMYVLAPELQTLTVRDLLSLSDPQADGRARPSGKEQAESHRAKVLDTFFAGDLLTRMPVQKRKRDIVLEQFAAKFAPEVRYDERDVDELVSTWYADYCLVRRLLVDEGYFYRRAGVYERTAKPACLDLRFAAPNTAAPDRTAGPPTVTAPSPTENSGERRNMEDTNVRRAALRRSYAERAKQAGVFRVLNTANGWVMLGSALDLHAPLNRVKFELDNSLCWNRELSRDLEAYGRDSFAIEVLETVEPREDPDFDPKRELEALEQKYLSTLDWTTAYNRDGRIRYP